MTTPRIELEVTHDLSWWHWTLTIPLLVAHLLGEPWALPSAIGLCAVVAAYYFARLRSLHPLPVQVRAVYMVLLACGSLPGLQWLHWVQLAGTTTMVTVGYCPLSRLLSLLPFNRTEPLSARFVWKTTITNPNAGGLVSWTDHSIGEEPACSCSLRPSGISASRSASACNDPHKRNGFRLTSLFKILQEEAHS